MNAGGGAALGRWFDAARAEIDAELERRLPAGDGGDDAARLREAMRYATLGPGKRLRPALVLAACEAVGGARRGALPAAAAVELLHAYTLVHDDLPAMDDDVERRGRPTAHVAFGEGLAILAGDALLTAAFAALADLGARAAEAVAVLAARAGADELLAGQALDLELARRGGEPGLAELERIHARKTGALFSAAAELGGIAGGAGPERRSALARYGLCLGIAFQNADDLADSQFSGLAEEAAKRSAELLDEAAGCARQAAASAGGAAPLLELAGWLRARFG